MSTTVYVLFTGEYEDYRAKAVYSTLELAEAAKPFFDDGECPVSIEEIKIDPPNPDPPPAGMDVFAVDTHYQTLSAHRVSAFDAFNKVGGLGIAKQCPRYHFCKMPPDFAFQRSRMPLNQQVREDLMEYNSERKSEYVYELFTYARDKDHAKEILKEKIAEHEASL